MQKMSLSATGTPSNGPSDLALARRCVAAFAAARASLSVRRKNACRRPSSARMRASDASPLCSGACASTLSRGRDGCGSSSRRGRPAAASPAKLSGSTPATSTACSRSTYSSTLPSCAAKRSSSSSDKASLARRATCLTWARSIATDSSLRLVGRLEPVQDGLHDLVRVLVRLDVVPGRLAHEGATARRAVEEPDHARLFGNHQGAALRAAAVVQLAQRFSLALAQPLQLLEVELAQALGILAREVLVLGGARLLFESHLQSL